MSIHKLHASFNAGELSPLMDSRVDVEKYEAGCRKLRNFILNTHGPVFRRPGLEYMGEAASQETASRFIEFNFSATTTFVIEMAVEKFRFWHNGALVMADNAVLEVLHPYLADELFEVQCKQVNDVCYLAHRNHPPQKLTRLKDNQWECKPMPLRYPPLLDENVEKESVAVPTVTETYRMDLEEAVEFTLAKRTAETIPTFTIQAQPPPTPSAQNPWFDLSWIWLDEFPPGPAGKTLTLEVRNPAGTWVPVTGGAGVWLNAASAALPTNTKAVPPAQSFRCRPASVASTGLLVEKRTGTTWSSTVLAGFFGSTVTSSLTELTFRLVYGPPTQNPLPGRAVTVSPSVALSGSGPLLEAPYGGTLPLRPILQTHTSEDISTWWTLPNPVPAPARTLTWQVVNAVNKWVNLKSWTVPATGLIPESIFRLRYSSDANLAVEEKQADGSWNPLPAANMAPVLSCGIASGSMTVTMKSTAGRVVGEAVTGTGIPAGTTVAAVNSGTVITLSAGATVNNAVAGLTFSLQRDAWTLRLLYGPETALGTSKSSVVTCVVTEGSADVTMVSNTGLAVGQYISGTGVPPDTTVESLTGSTQITMSKVATATNLTSALTFNSGPAKVVLALPSAVTCAITSGSATVTMASTTGRAEGERVSGSGITPGTTIATVDSSTEITISAPATATSASASLTFHAAVHTANLERQKSGTGADAGRGGITVRAGNWQARMEVTAGTGTVPADGGTLSVQKWNPAVGWQTLGTAWTVAAGKLYIYSGVQSGAFTTDTLVRLLYKGGSGADPSHMKSAGFAVIETIEYPPSEAVTLEVSVVNGPNRTLLAKKSGGTAASLFVMPVEDPPSEGHRGSYWQIVHRRDESYAELVGAVGTFPAGVDGASLQSKVIRVAGQWDLFTYGSWKGTLHLERRTNSNAWQIIRTWTSNYDRNATASGNEDEDADLRLRINSGAAGQAASGAAVPRFVLEAADSRIYGLVQVKEVVSESEAIVDVVRTIGDTAATSLWAEGAWSDVRGYPSALGLHEARLWFGGSKYQPQTLWASVSNDFENFRRSTLDDGSLAVTLAAESSNSIRWLSSATALLIGTGGEEWALRSGTDGPLTPTSARAERQSGYSSMALGAKMVHEVTIFVQRDARRVRQLSYTNAQQSYTAGDLTVLAPHVTAGGIRQMAFQQAPTAILWAVTNDGRLAGMTFEREQNVFGWHVHDTDGEIETVAVLHGTPADEVWCGVKRVTARIRSVECGITEGETLVGMPSTAGRMVGEEVTGAFIPAGAVIMSIDSDTQVTLSAGATATREVSVLTFTSMQTRRYVERMQPQAMASDWSEQRTLVYADSARRYAYEEPQAEVEGLDHLEGRTVVILADGGVHDPRVVQNGAITLGAPAEHVVVGLPYTSEVQPMKQEVQLQDGTAQGRRFKLHGVTLRMDHSLGGEVSANAADASLPWAKMPNRIVMGEPTPLFSGERDLILDSRHEAAVNLTVRQRDPLPLNVTALVLRFDVYEH
jgi:hypothetical protein